MSEAEVRALVDFLALNPMAGEEMKGTGGCRKLRWAGRGRGKSGGYRAITFYTGVEIPVFLITLFSKGERANLTKEEQNALAKLTRLIVAEYRVRVVKVGRS